MVRIITLPNGKQVTLGRYVQAWKKLLEIDPDTEIAGWGFEAQPASSILREMRRGLDDRINRHDRTRPQKWRKLQSSWYWEIFRAADQLNDPRLIIGWLPTELKTRFSHRLRENMDLD